MDKKIIREIIAKRAALELKDGDVVNLGIGLPTQIPNYLPEGISVTIHSENGLLGMGETPQPGEEDPNYTNAGGGFVKYIPGAYACSTQDSFALIRGGHIDVTFLGALQVDEKGNLANWMIPGKKSPGMGGAMDLLSGAKTVILAMEHTAKGAKKILKECTLPLTAAGKVKRVITEMGVIDITNSGMVLREINSNFTVEEVQAATEATLIIDENLKTF